MLHNASFWHRYFQSMFQPHLERMLDVLEQRLLPTFDGIEEEATALQEKTYNDLVSMPLDPDTVDESRRARSLLQSHTVRSPSLSETVAAIAADR